MASLSIIAGTSMSAETYAAGVIAIHAQGIWDDLEPEIVHPYVLNSRKIAQVAVLSDVIVGYAIVVKGLESYSIAYLGVHPDFQKQKIGTALLDKVFDMAKEEEASKISLHFNTEKKYLAKFYKAFAESHGLSVEEEHLYQTKLTLKF